MNRISLLLWASLIYGFAFLAACPVLQDVNVPCESHLDCPSDFGCHPTKVCVRGIAESKLVVEPGKVNVGLAATTAFTAKLDGKATSEVTWSVEGADSLGTINNSGLYTSPSKLAGWIRVKIWAALGRHPEIKASAIVTVQPPDTTTAWVMSYFQNGALPKSVNQDSLHLAYSRDGLKWTPFALTGGASYRLTGFGSNHLRDPFIMRKQDGTFVLLATDWTRSYSDVDYWSSPSPNIIVADSEDLITFKNPRLLHVGLDDLGNEVPMHAWGPEAFYDPDLDQYGILWSGNDIAGVGRIYVSYTKDFQTLVNATPTVFFDPGYSVTDATLVQTDGASYLLFKDDRDSDPDPSTGKDIQIARSTSLAPGSFTLSSPDYLTRGADQSTRAGTEGPFVIKPPLLSTWYMCADYSLSEGAGCWSSPDLDASPGLWTRVEAASLSMPAGIQHANAVRVTDAELTALIEHKGGASTVRIKSTYVDATDGPYYLTQSANHGIVTFEGDTTANQVPADFYLDLWPGFINPNDPSFVSIASNNYAGTWLRINSKNPAQWPDTAASPEANKYEYLSRIPPDQRNHLLFLDPYISSTEFARDATFKIMPALNGDPSMVSLKWCGETKNGTCEDMEIPRFLCYSYFHVFAYRPSDKCVVDPDHPESSTASTANAMSFTLVGSK